MIHVTDTVFIREDELMFTASRSSGPGGQHVNKVSTRMTLLFNVAASPSLSDEQKQRICSRLSTRVSKKGVLRIISQRHRSQAANRDATVERFVELLKGALTELPPREKTTVPKRARQRRLDEKKQHSLKKQQRAKIISNNE
ncbi:MAG: alternative ribosome rescue aminoacyl-tRNA hydrolase ArfB [Dissulfuribacterales bacterium]